jgi:hypothetical protein
LVKRRLYKGRLHGDGDGNDGDDGESDDNDGKSNLLRCIPYISHR